MKKVVAGLVAFTGFVGLSASILVSASLFAQDNARHELAKAQHEERLIIDQMRELELKLIAIEEDIERLQAQADQHEQSRIRQSDLVEASKSKLEALKKEITDRARFLYHLERRGFARIVFSNEDPSKLRKTRFYLRTLVGEDAPKIQSAVKEVDNKKTALEQLEVDRRSRDAAMAQLQLKGAEVTDQKARLAKTKSEIATRKSLAEAAVNVRSEGRTQLQETLPVVEETPSTPAPTASGIKETPRRTAGPEVQEKQSFRSQQGRLPWPTTGKLMRGFGRTKNPTTGAMDQNDGIDIQAAFGTPVRAVADGVVSHTGYIDGFGLVVILEHGSYATVYAHLGRIQVARGEEVDQGENIGLVGETGVTDNGGPRLHFEIRYNKSPQNPNRWLRNRSRGGR